MRRNPTPEGCIQRAVLDLLTVTRVWHVRLNSRTVMMPGRGGKTRPVFFGAPGMADILAMPMRRFSEAEAEMSFAAGASAVMPLWIECKAEKGKQSDQQKEFERSVIEAGQSYIVARSSDDVLEWMKKNGASGR